MNPRRVLALLAAWLLFVAILPSQPDPAKPLNPYRASLISAGSGSSAFQPDSFARALLVHAPLTLLAGHIGTAGAVTGDPMVTDVDWRTKGAVTPVKNQGPCGSAWAFSATGALEGLGAISGKGLDNLSEQQLIDCSRSDGNAGCNGGTPDRAFEWDERHGPASEASYPYTARDGACKIANAVLPPIFRVVRIPQGDEQALAAAVAEQPVSVAVDASGGFQSYHGGVFQGPCGRVPNQDVLIVGFTPTYWIVKNSWGTGWGASGYIFMARGKNLCGIADFASAPKY